MRAKQKKRKQSKKKKQEALMRVNYKRAAERALLDPWRMKVVEEVQRKAMGLGFQMEGRLLDGGADHWMFNDFDGRRLLNYWPTNGTFWDPNSGFRGKEMSACAILEMVETITNERKANAIPL